VRARGVAVIAPLALTAIGLAAFGTCALTVGLVRQIALRRQWLDVPNARSSHVRPTPRLGGLGLLGGLIAGGLVSAALVAAATGSLVVLLGLGGVVSIVSLTDDLRGLPPLARLTVHLAVAIAAVGLLGPLPLRSAPVDVAAMLAGAASLVWIAGFVNAFNFMDGIDGIAGGQALVAGAGWTAAGWWLGQPALAVLGLVIAAAAAAFLLYNWSPASIFMGDVGSALLGFLLAAAPLAAEGPARPPVDVAVLMVWPFAFDAAFTLVRRASRGEALMQAHRSHLYQRLVQAGWPHGAVALLYLLLGTISAIAATLALVHEAFPAGAAMAMAVAIATGLWLVVRRVERRVSRASVLSA
jgi:UDP-N-acetylmuramyl pentapeptide phosphotransferase/UDP-N-acetylglucosamine-1-phosphate transferase